MGFLRRLIWTLMVGLMIAFHNFYQKEFQGVDEVTQEIVEEEED